VSTIRYVGHGVEIEDDFIRLSRRKLESEHDAGRRAHGGPARRWRKALGPARVVARWR